MDRAGYDASSIDWIRIRHLAERVAGETRTPRASREAKVIEKRERTVAGGFLNLAKRVETYAVEVAQTVPTDYWVLAVTFWSKKTRLSDAVDERRRAKTEYCLRANGELFGRSESWDEIDTHDGNGFCQTGDVGLHEWQMDERQILRFDFRPDRYHDATGDVTVDTDDEPSDELLYSRKGAGLEASLDKLLGRPE